MMESRSTPELGNGSQDRECDGAAEGPLGVTCGSASVNPKQVTCGYGTKQGKKMKIRREN